MRDGFHEIVSGWMTVFSFGDLSERIERAAEWTKANGPLQADEQATITLMIETQVARGVARGDFEPFIGHDPEYFE